jgi:YaeC family lipoprotein
MSNNLNFQLKKNRKHVWATLGIVALIAAIGTFFYFKSQESGAVVFGDALKVHYEPAEAGEERILDFVAKNIAPDYGIKIVPVGIQDPIIANGAVADGEYAATIYQHEWYLRQIIEANGFELTPVFPVFQWSFGVYSDKYKSIGELPDGAVIAIPVDTGNQGQALWLLAREGLIGLNPDVEPRVAVLRDIVSNPRKFEFKELDFLTLPRVLDSVDAALGFIGNFDAGKIPREKGIFFPPAPRTFAAQFVVGTKFLNDPKIKKLQEVFKDKRLDEYLRTTDDPLVRGVLTPVSEN